MGTISDLASKVVNTFSNPSDLYQAMRDSCVSAAASDEERAEWEDAFHKGVFYVVAEQTFVGQYAMGSTSFEYEGTTYLAPCLLPTLTAAQEELNEERSMFLTNQQEGNDMELENWLESEEDEDDFEPDDSDYEGVVYMVKWDGNDKIEIFDETGAHELDLRNTWQFHCGLD